MVTERSRRHCKLALCRPRYGLTASLRSYRAVGQRSVHTPWQEYLRMGPRRRPAEQLCSTPSRSISASARRSRSKTRSPLHSPSADTTNNSQSKARMLRLKCGLLLCREAEILLTYSCFLPQAVCVCSLCSPTLHILCCCH